MKSNYRPKPEFLWNEKKQILDTVTTNEKLLYNSLIPYKHVKFISEHPDEFITSSNNGDGTHIATMTLQTLCKLMMSTDKQHKGGK